MRYRGLLVLAIIAALLGAPSIASGAGNALTSPSVSPGSGTVDTIFTLTVSYDGQFRATGVTVAVGGQVLPMTRVGGSAKSGTWAASGTLPIGTWAPVFTATAERGGVATVTGSLVSIGGAVSPPTPDPTVTGSPKSPHETNEGGTPIDSDDPGDGGGDTPIAAPADNDAPDDSAEDSPVAEPATPAPDDEPEDTSAPDEPSAAGTSATPGSDDGMAPASAAPAVDDEDKPAAGPAAPSSGSSVPDQERGAGSDGPSASGPELLAEDDDVLGMVVLLGLAGVAGMAILGTGWLMAWRRRGGSADEAGARAAATEAVLERRTLRQARVRLEEDPIVAALGIDDQPTRRARRSARQVSRGPGERPTDRR